mmetsp:Transcript_100536/g.173634  ORF Transcript_100536/g.173634 Transcript_100536/m.173634 type:complete len:252 (+) Transcript_100536:1102-1857(+)
MRRCSKRCISHGPWRRFGTSRNTHSAWQRGRRTSCTSAPSRAWMPTCSPAACPWTSCRRNQPLLPRRPPLRPLPRLLRPLRCPSVSPPQCSVRPGPRPQNPRSCSAAPGRVRLQKGQSPLRRTRRLQPRPLMGLVRVRRKCHRMKMQKKRTVMKLRRAMRGVAMARGPGSGSPTTWTSSTKKNASALSKSTIGSVGRTKCRSTSRRSARVRARARSSRARVGLSRLGFPGAGRMKSRRSTTCRVSAGATAR